MLQAYEKLKKSNSLFSFKIPDSLEQIINSLNSNSINKRKVTASEYSSIRYKNIYYSYKDVVDFSWHIINNFNFSYGNDNDKKGTGIFIDMAEIWEVYIRTLISNKLKTLGWNVACDCQYVYKETFFKRKIIPDIVIRKDNKVIVLDAKYKKMINRKIDVDRSDFFQIHTYMSFYNQYELLAGGLIYPIIGDKERNNSNSLFGLGKDNIKFFIDGINVIDLETFEKSKIEFLDSIIEIAGKY